MNPVRRPGTAYSFVTEFEGSGKINPNPVIAKDSDLLFDIYLSPAKLRNLSGSDDLQQVTSLEMRVDTRETILGNFGVHLPNLVQLKMNNSLILSVRDLGISLSHLQVLSLVRCGLVDLEGLPSLSSLKELYVAYNNVSDLSQVCMLEQLELVDLEGNDVDDLVQVQYLGLCGKLKTLTLEGNPVYTCPRPGASQVQVSEYNYRSAVRKLIPQLQVLDDAPAEEEEPRCSSSMMADWALLKDSIKDTTSITDSTDDCLELMELRGASVCDLPRPMSAQRPGTSVGYSSPLSRPSTARPPSSSVSSRPSSADSDADTPNYETSDLTHGVGRVLFCGNPLQAIRARRQKIKLQSPSSHSRPCTQLSSYVPEHTYDVEETSSQDRSDVFAELRAWRKEHNKRLLAIERDRQPQVMRIVHNDDDDDDDENKDSSNEYDEGAHSLSLISDREDEDETQEGQKTGHIDNKSPDSSFQSLSPEASRLLSLSDHTMAPSPPPRGAAPSTDKRIAEIRARRLKISNMGVGMQKLTRETIRSDVTASRDMNHNVLCPEALKMQPTPPQILCKPHRPGSSPGIMSQRGRCSGTSLPKSEHKPIICSLMPDRTTSTRPHTARAALQRPLVHPSKAIGHLD
ncbi:leucine-rich repeat-containing protein 56 isoform X1 [Ictalurus furcatus]|uniref:leucine-rich repeat-containing protein 56 isoform X1 n=2 Tax=Ictalurus furcatus TaxID=66913 RepID=UPI00234FFB08|nr:leucine-rich repeat-containing protein 56 isoform X1 [Ictalurus furcatus]